MWPGQHSWPCGLLFAASLCSFKQVVERSRGRWVQIPDRCSPTVAFHGFTHPTNHTARLLSSHTNQNPRAVRQQLVS